MSSDRRGGKGSDRLGGKGSDRRRGKGSDRRRGKGSDEWRRCALETEDEHVGEGLVGRCLLLLHGAGSSLPLS